jgi:hypothetical protein
MPGPFLGHCNNGIAYLYCRIAIKGSDIATIAEFPYLSCMKGRRDKKHKECYRQHSNYARFSGAHTTTPLM